MDNGTELNDTWSIDHFDQKSINKVKKTDWLANIIVLFSKVKSQSGFLLNRILCLIICKSFMMFRSEILQFTEFNKILNLAFTGAKRKVLDR